MTMMNMNEADLTSVETHFAFGRNWAEFSEKVDETEIGEAERGLRRLIEEKEIVSRSFLDIGCGSGLHALAALRLGAKRVVAFDIDANSVATAKAMLERHASPEAAGNWQVEEKSVFDLLPEKEGRFDVVYSWGVLHHTGDLLRALDSTAACVAPGGLFCFALYRRIWLDCFWRLEKRWYAKAGHEAQARARRCYVGLHSLVFGRREHECVVTNYHGNRGMDYYHDVHDWMGGWPYESISPEEVKQHMQTLRFEPVRKFVLSERFHRHIGLFGSGCDEYVYRRQR
jgi:SAM-dependent methyltransferase